MSSSLAGLLKCALQEFQHRYPQLISRIRSEGGLQSYFVPMECPTLPLDVDFKCRDMLHAKFDTDQGPLWRVQLITEATMDKAALGETISRTFDNLVDLTDHDQVSCGYWLLVLLICAQKT